MPIINESEVCKKGQALGCMTMLLVQRILNLGSSPYGHSQDRLQSSDSNVPDGMQDYTVI